MHRQRKTRGVRLRLSLHGIRGSDMKKVWETPDPTKKDKKLSPKKKAAAKSMAKAAGRPYPNLVDNMRAARKGK